MRRDLSTWLAQDCAQTPRHQRTLPHGAFAPSPSCGASVVGTKYLVRVHSISFSAKKILLTSHFLVSSRYTTVLQTLTAATNHSINSRNCWSIHRYCPGRGEASQRVRKVPPVRMHRGGQQLLHVSNRALAKSETRLLHVSRNDRSTVTDTTYAGYMGVRCASISLVVSMIF